MSTSTSSGSGCWRRCSSGNCNSSPPVRAARCMAPGQCGRLPRAPGRRLRAGGCGRGRRGGAGGGAAGGGGGGGGGGEGGGGERRRRGPDVAGRALDQQVFAGR